jgi:putative phosphoribosyl transferase
MPVTVHDLTTFEVAIPVQRDVVFATLTLPPRARGLVVFAHGSGSSRFSSRNRAVAQALQEAHYGTLLLDLLTTSEEEWDQQSGEYRFDIPRLARRLIQATEWANGDEHVRGLPVAYFGASTGAAAALVAAAELPSDVRAVVSRGGRPDLAGPALEQVRAPTLLIVGARDREVLQLNQQAQRQMGTMTRIEVVPNASHLFEEPGTLERVAILAREWFDRYLAVPRDQNP